MITQLALTQLVENTAGGPGLLAEHGVSFFIEADGQHLLFDTGQGLALKHNVQKLDLPMASVEQIILSHGHYDHSGGLMAALELAGPVDLYLHPDALSPKYNRNGREIGSPIADEQTLARLVKRMIPTQGPTEILPRIHVTGEIPRRHAIEDTGGPFYQDADRTRSDPLPDDQALYIETKAGLVVILGCGHSGVINTLDYIQQLTDGQTIHAVIGGMHLLRASSERLSFTKTHLDRLGVRYLSPNHCTGLEAVCRFKTRFPQAFHESRRGDKHLFGDR